MKDKFPPYDPTSAARLFAAEMANEESSEFGVSVHVRKDFRNIGIAFGPHSFEAPVEDAEKLIFALQTAVTYAKKKGAER